MRWDIEIGTQSLVVNRQACGDEAGLNAPYIQGALMSLVQYFGTVQIPNRVGICFSMYD
jgi:hypothetical protein